MNRKLYVANINFKATETDVERLFAEVGAVASVKIIYDHQARSRGFGFVEMATPAEADKAMKAYAGYTFMGRQLVVDEARDYRRQPSYDRR